MRRLTIIALAGVLTGCDSAVSQAKRYAADQMKDPSSVQFREVRRGAPGYVCGEVNAKNSYGAYTGFRRFYVISSFVEIENDDHPFTDLIWLDKCATSNSDKARLADLRATQDSVERDSLRMVELKATYASRNFKSPAQQNGIPQVFQGLSLGMDSSQLASWAGGSLECNREQKLRYRTCIARGRRGADSITMSWTYSELSKTPVTISVAWPNIRRVSAALVDSLSRVWGEPSGVATFVGETSIAEWGGGGRWAATISDFVGQLMLRLEDRREIQRLSNQNRGAAIP